MKRRYARARIGAAWSAVLTAAIAVGCSVTDAGDASGTFLVVTTAHHQPVSAALGTIVVLQQQGGARLRLRSEKGTHAVTQTVDMAGTKRTQSCLPAEDAGALLFLTVVPDDGEECLFYVDLLGPGSLDKCPGVPLRSAVVPISTVRADPAPDGGGGGAGGGGGGSGGASTSTTSATTAASATSGGGGAGGGTTGAGGKDGG